MLAVPPPLIHLSHHFLTYFHSTSLSLPTILELSFAPPPAFFLTTLHTFFFIIREKKGIKLSQVSFKLQQLMMCVY